MCAKHVWLVGCQVVAELVMALVITNNMIACLQVPATRACNIFRGHMVLVVLAHEGTSKAALSHQAIKMSRQVTEVGRWVQ